MICFVLGDKYSIVKKIQMPVDGYNGYCYTFAESDPVIII